MSPDLVTVVTAVLSDSHIVDEREVLECRLLLAEEAVRSGVLHAAEENLVAAANLLGPAPCVEALERLEALQRSIASPKAAVLGPEPLTSREIEILELAARGFSRREIGELLYLSFNTIKTHYRKIFRKLGVRSRDEAIQVAANCDLLQLGDVVSVGR